MLLDDLYQAIEKLRERMEDHQDKLRQSEALTRNALVDPLLRVLGWDTEDPALAMPEYRLGSGFADYALLNAGKPAIVIEAKKLGTPLYSAAEQSVTYCVNDGIRYFVATDGRKWDVYETHRPVPLAEKKIVSFDITDSPADVCLDALVLWRRSVQSGTVRKAQTPVVEPQHEPLVAVNQQESAPVPVATPSKAAAAPAHEGNWQTLAQWRPDKEDNPPPEIRFPDGSTSEIKNWADIPAAAVRWLYDNGKLDETQIPLRSGSRFILNDSPSHSTGEEFKVRRQAGKFYVEGNYNKSSNVRNASTMIERVGKGVTPAQFSVRLS